MNLSMKWLSDYVNLPNISMKEFSDAMTMSGSKVEKYDQEGKTLKNIVVGEILKISPHPDAKRLVVCSVNVGSENQIQIVTAAKNMQEGDKVPVALDGSILADGSKIKKGKLRGVLSQGMFCSIAEVGVTTGDFPYAIEDGLFILQEKCVPGQDIRDAIGLDDNIVEFEITSNRPDCMSVIGLAREAAATFNVPLNLPIPQYQQKNENSTEQLKVSIQDKKACPMYSAAIVKNVKIKPSPRWIRERLRAMGVRPINNIVDITNYVMLEYGQPMHAFDLRDVSGHQINVRYANNGEFITTLDDSKLKLTEKDLVICDSEKPLALAGVMGGKFTGVKDDTTTIIFESANFNACTVRMSAKRHGFRTESSARFEKGLDPNNCIPALSRALELICELNAGEVICNIITQGSPDTKKIVIDLDVNWINKFLGTNIEREFMEEVLKKISCEVNDDKIIVPSFRADLKTKYDIAEEIARFYGYNKISANPMKSSCIGEYSKIQKFRKALCDSLISLGLSEAMTYSFIGPNSFDKMLLPQNDKLRDCIIIRNPLGETTSIMRTTGFPSMMEALAKNLGNRNENAKLFELVKEYTKEESTTPACEKEKIVIGMYGNDVDYFLLKGIIEELIDKFSTCEYHVEAVTNMPSMHPGRTAKILVNEKTLCLLGQVHPTVAENFKLNIPVYYMSIDLSVFYEILNQNVHYVPLPKFPGVTRDLCLICNKDTTVQSLEKVISKSAGKLLEETKLFDVYEGSNIPDGKKSVAFRINLRSNEGTLTDEQICRIIDKIVKSFNELGVTLRDA